MELLQSPHQFGNRRLYNYGVNSRPSASESYISKTSCSKKLSKYGWFLSSWTVEPKEASSTSTSSPISHVSTYFDEYEDFIEYRKRKSDLFLARDRHHMQQSRGLKQIFDSI